MKSFEDFKNEFFLLQESHNNFKQEIDKIERKKKDILIDFLIESEYLNEFAWEIDEIIPKLKQICLSLPRDHFPSSFTQILSKFSSVDFLYKDHSFSLKYFRNEENEICLNLFYLSNPAHALEECGLKISKISQEILNQISLLEKDLSQYQSLLIHYPPQSLI